MVQQSIFDFEVATTKEQLTAHAGLVPLMEYNQALRVQQRVNRHCPLPGSNRGFSPSVMVDTLVMMLTAGGRTLEDVRTLKRESTLCKLVGIRKLPDPDTMGDWLRRMAKGDGLAGLGRVRDELNADILSRDSRTDYTLDIDATFIEAQKETAQWSYKKAKGYMPMMGFLDELPLCVGDDFRDGNESPGSEHVQFYEDCVARMPEGKHIARFRADSASYQADLFNRLEKDGVFFAITADQDTAVKECIRSIPNSSWKDVGGGWEIAETVHSMNETNTAFRLVVKREMNRQLDLFEPDNYFYHAVASNFPGEAKSTYAVLKWHNARGQAENLLKELKCGFGMEYMPCGTTDANAVFFRCGVLAYNLFVGFKRDICPPERLSQSIATFRWQVVQCAGRIVHHARKTIVRLAATQETLEMIRTMRQRCYVLTT